MTGKRALPVVALDGPSGSGKSTMGRRLAERLGFRHVDTGALYRALALRARDEGIPPDDAAALADLARRMNVTFQWREGQNRVIVDGQDRTEAARSEAVGMDASRVSAHPAVRSALLDLQRRLGAAGGVVMDGRDIGTVVFPDAEFKFFLTADLEVRAQRRFEELRRKGLDVSFEEVMEALAARDQRDSQRAVAPCRPAPDAISVDTSHLSPEQVLALLESRVRGFPGDGTSTQEPPVRKTGEAS